MYPWPRQRQCRVEDELKRIGRGPDRGFAPDQASARSAERTLGEHHVEPSRVELLNQFRTDADLYFELHARMQRSETAERRRQRATGNFLGYPETHSAGQTRRHRTMARCPLKLQETTGVAQEPG
jgi:hypothetical protein